MIFKSENSTPAAATPPERRGTRRPSRGRDSSRFGVGLRTFLVALPVPIFLLVLWSAGTANAWTLPLGIQMGNLPSPLDVAKRLLDFAFGGFFSDAYSRTLLLHLWESTLRVVQGFALAVVVGVPLGVMMGRSPRLSAALDPTINLIRPIPVTAWAPLALIMIGFGSRATIFLVFLSAVFPILVNTISGVKQVPVRYIEASQMLGTPPLQALYKVVLPASMPSIVAGLRLALGLSWVILVVGETVGIRDGLGAVITQAREQSRTDLIVTGMIVIGLAGYLSDRLLLLVIRLIARRRPLLAR